MSHGFKELNRLIKLKNKLNKIYNLTDYESNLFFRYSVDGLVIRHDGYRTHTIISKNAMKNMSNAEVVLAVEKVFRPILDASLLAQL
jgi:hypothetical protein